MGLSLTGLLFTCLTIVYAGSFSLDTSTLDKNEAKHGATHHDSADVGLDGDSVVKSNGIRILDPGDDSTIVQPAHSQPWVVGIMFPVYSLFGLLTTQCGGTLISKKHVISAAHCDKVIATHVAVGDHDQTIPDGEQIIKIVKKTRHPDYDISLPSHILQDADLIIYELEKEVQNTKPACLPRENEMFNSYTVSGWGGIAMKKNPFDSTETRIISKVLRTVELVDEHMVSGSYRACGPSFNSAAAICGESLKDNFLGPCNGDSGGPWVAKKPGDSNVILAGVHRDGNCDRRTRSHVAVKVSYPRNLSWIKGVTGISITCHAIPRSGVPDSWCKSDCIRTSGVHPACTHSSGVDQRCICEEGSSCKI